MTDAGPPAAGQAAKNAHPAHFEHNVLYEFDHVDQQGSTSHRKVQAKGFILVAKDLDSRETVQIDISEIKNLERFMGTT